MGTYDTPSGAPRHDPAADESTCSFCEELLTALEDVLSMDSFALGLARLTTTDKDTIARARAAIAKAKGAGAEAKEFTPAVDPLDGSPFCPEGS